MSTAYFHAVDDGTPNRFRPEPIAHGPWATDMMHGRLLGGLAAKVLEAEHGGDGWRAARLTDDLFRPSAMEVVTVTTHSVRAGRRLRVADAVLSCDGHEVGRVTAVFLPTSEDPPGHVWAPPPSAWPDPDQLKPNDGDGDVNGWLFRVIDGGFGTGKQSRVWTNDTVELVAGEPMSPLVRAAVSGDLACPLGNSGDAGLFFINADYTMLLGRYPVGSWIGLEVDHRIAADGISITSATMVDRNGPFATSGGTSLARPPLEGHGPSESGPS
jgi:hypothetical protein